MIPAERALRAARRVVLALTLAAVLYALARFDLVQLPDGARSPLYGVHPGDRLFVDRLARSPRPGEAWLFRAPDGALRLGRCGEPPGALPERERAALAGGAAWLLSEREVPGLADSRVLGAIAPEALEGRVVLVLPW
jgi:hypothetical protein